MSDRLRSMVRQQPCVAFYALAFICTWASWVPLAAYSHGLFPFDTPFLFFLGGIGPLAATLVVSNVLYGKSDGEEVFKPLFRWRVGIVWYLVALGASIGITLVALGLRGELLQMQARLALSPALLMAFLRYLFAAIPEEVAWRGFVLPRLQARYNALTASLIIGGLWALWHVPLLLEKGSVMATYPVIPYLIGTTASAVIYTWLYNNTGGSVLIACLFHAMSNTVGPNAGVQYTAVILFVAAAIVIWSGPTLSYRRTVTRFQSQPRLH